MKVLRFLILAALILSLSLAVAPARAAGASMGYIALVTQANPKMPLAVQAEREFQRLAPALLAAKQSGYVADFKPEFRAGIVMLRFGSQSGAASLAAGMLGLPVYGSSADALAMVPHERPTPGVSATTVSAHFWLDVYDSCFQGTVPTNAHVIASLRNGSGLLLAKAEFNEQDDGAADGWLWQCFNWSSNYEVVPGYKIAFKVYDAPGGTLLGTFAATTPRMKFSTLNKSTAVVTGAGPAGKSFCVSWGQPALNAAGDWLSDYRCGTIGSSGTWSRDLYTGSLRGGAGISYNVEQTSAITFSRYMNVPYIYCKLGGNYCEIYGFAFQSATLKIIHNSTTYTFTGKGNAWGWFSAQLRNSNGDPIILKAGDQVQGTDVALYTQPTLSFNAFDFANDVVSGKAPAGKYFNVWVQAPSAPYWWTGYWGHSNSSGNFSVDTTADFDLLSTEASEAEIYYIHRATGNATDYTRVYVP